MVDLLDQWGTWYLPLQALAVAFTAFVPPFPAEVMVIASGAMAADQLLPLWLVVTATVVGCFAGDVALYVLFRYKFLRVLYRWRWGRRMHRLVLRTTLRAGGASTWVGLLLIRWLPGGRATSMVTAGMSRLSWARLIALAVLGAIIWSLWLIGLGYITGTTTGLSPVVSTLMGLGIGTLVGLVIAWAVARKRGAHTQV